MTDKSGKHLGTSFDDFLEGEGIKAEVEAVALKRVIAWQITQAMEKRHMSKSDLARAMNTSRSQLDRLLDPENDALTLHTLTRVAQTLRMKVDISLSTPES